LTYEMSDHFGDHLYSGIEKLRNETVSMFSEEQLTAYEELSRFLMYSGHGVAIV
jgi:hypothetical protein